MNLEAITNILGKEGHEETRECGEQMAKIEHFINSHRLLISNILNSGPVSRLLPEVRCIIGKWGIKKTAQMRESWMHLVYILAHFKLPFT